MILFNCNGPIEYFIILNTNSGGGGERIINKKKLASRFHRIINLRNQGVARKAIIVRTDVNKQHLKIKAHIYNRDVWNRYLNKLTERELNC